MTVALVTGGTGFIGAHVVRALLAEPDVEVRALVRPASDTRNLDGLAVQRVVGDLTDASSLRAAVAGADVVFHVAARYELARRDRALTMRSNVEGTIALMRAALEAGVDRVVYTSSTAAVGAAGRDGVPVDESQWLRPAEAAGLLGRLRTAGEAAWELGVVQEGAGVRLV